MDSQPRYEDPPPGSPGAWERLRARLELETVPCRVGGVELVIPQPRDPVAYIQARLERGEVQGDRLPYWTKLWPAALVLAQSVAEMKLPRAPVLELGAGLGVPGLVAAARGRPVVLSDLDPEALEFARAAAELSGLERRVEVRRLDWRRPPDHLEPFLTVLGAEILYQPELYPALWDLLQRVVAPGGRVFLSLQERPFSVGFFARADGRFRLRGTRRRLRHGDQEVVVQLCLLERRGDTSS